MAPIASERRLLCQPLPGRGQSQFGRRTRYVKAVQVAKISARMIRSASLLVIAGALWSGAAHAQMSGADLVTRIDRLQAQVRELTGTVEELQYRNQQLEQELQRMRAAAPGTSGPNPPLAQSLPAASPRSP